MTDVVRHGRTRGGGQRLRRNALLTSAWVAWLAALATTPIQAAPDPVTSAPAATRPDPVQLTATQLIKVVGQSDATTRREAAAAILRTDSPEGTKALLGVFNVDNNEAAKIAVCEALADVKPQVHAFIGPLERLLNHKNPALRNAAAAALASYNDPQVAARLATFRHRQERALLAEALDRLMDTLYEATADEAKRVSLLQDWLKSPLSVQRLKAMQIVADALRGKGAKPTADILAQIRTLLTDPDEPVRIKAVGLIRDLGLTEDAPQIRDLLAREQSPAVREEIYKALGKLTDPASIDLCIAGLAEPEDKVAAAAVDALGQLCQKGSGRSPETIAAATDALLKRMARPIDNVQLRRDLVEAMADIADPAFAPALVRHTGADELEPTVRQAAIRGLGRIGDPANIGVVLDLLANDPDAGVRQVAAQAAGALGRQPNHLQALRARLDRGTEPTATVSTAAWDAYMQVFQRLDPADQLAAISSWNGSEPSRPVLLAAAVKPEIRAAVAASLLKYVESLNSTDPLAAVAFLDQLSKTVPDRFGPEWAARFDAIRPPPATSPPATRPAPASAARP